MVLEPKVDIRVRIVPKIGRAERKVITEARAFLIGFEDRGPRISIPYHSATVSFLFSSPQTESEGSGLSLHRLAY